MSIMQGTIAEQSHNYKTKNIMLSKMFLRFYLGILKKKQYLCGLNWIFKQNRLYFSHKKFKTQLFTNISLATALNQQIQNNINFQKHN